MRKNPGAAGAILSHATKMAELRRKQAEAAHQKLIRLTQDTGAGYIRPGDGETKRAKLEQPGMREITRRTSTTLGLNKPERRWVEKLDRRGA